jgi:hypothetical protein
MWGEFNTEITDLGWVKHNVKWHTNFILRKVKWGLYCIYLVCLAGPQVRQLVTNFLLWEPGFSFRVVHLGFVVDIMALVQVFVRALQLSEILGFRTFRDIGFSDFIHRPGIKKQPKEKHDVSETGTSSF